MLCINPKTIKPVTINQQKYISLMNKAKPYVVIASGSAGSGKTLLATHMGLQKLQSGEVDRLIITRPIVSVDEQIGHLPGTLVMKLDPWMRPFMDVFQLHYPKSKVEKLIKENVIEISPLGFMRGRTFDNSWIICDEAQNTTPNQILMVLTRIGKNSKMIITGDISQHDRGYDSNGLSDLINRLNNHDRIDETMIGQVQFNSSDVQRHQMIPYVLDLYGVK